MPKMSKEERKAALAAIREWDEGDKLRDAGRGSWRGWEGYFGVGWSKKRIMEVLKPHGISLAEFVNPLGHLGSTNALRSFEAQTKNASQDWVDPRHTWILREHAEINNCCGVLELLDISELPQEQFVNLITYAHRREELLHSGTTGGMLMATPMDADMQVKPWMKEELEKAGFAHLTTFTNPRTGNVIQFWYKIVNQETAPTPPPVD
jgi:hypothetical protein